MSAAVKTGKVTIRIVNSVVDTLVLLAILLLVAVGGYALWDSKRVYTGADAKRYEVYKPTAQNEGASFADLQAINPDVFAWITVYGTHIDYPVVQGPDNMKYVNTNVEGHHCLSGAIFLDSRSSKDFTSFPSILYGHHMEKNAMFGEIGNFSAQNYFDARQYGTLYYGGQEHGLEFFAFLHANAYDDAVFKTGIAEQDARHAYLSMLLETALHTRDIKTTADDRIVLLSTCSARTTNGRDILAAKITDTAYGNPFISENADNSKQVPAQERTGGECVAVSIWLVILFLLFPLILLALILSWFLNRRRHNRNTRGYNPIHLRR